MKTVSGLNQATSSMLRVVLSFVNDPPPTMPLPWTGKKEQEDNLGVLIAQQNHMTDGIRKKRSEYYDAAGLHSAVHKALYHLMSDPDELYKQGVAVVPQNVRIEIGFEIPRPETGARETRPVKRKPSTARSEQSSSSLSDPPTDSSSSKTTSPNGDADWSFEQSESMRKSPQLSPLENIDHRSTKKRKLDKFHNPNVGELGAADETRRLSAGVAPSAKVEELRPEVENRQPIENQRLVENQRLPENAPPDGQGESLRENELTDSAATDVHQNIAITRNLQAFDNAIIPDEVKTALERIQHLVNQFSIRCAGNMKAYPVRRPVPELRSLYERMFASKNWSDRILIIRDANVFDGDQLLSGLVGLWLFVKVFNRPSPWRVERQHDMLGGPLWSEFDTILQGIGTDLGSILDQAAFNLLENEAFSETTLQDHVAMLTSDLSATIFDQVKMFEDIAVTPNSATSLASWRKYLADIVEKSVLLKAKMEVPSRFKWAWLWFESGGDFVPGDMAVVGAPSRGELSQVSITVMPGVRAEPRDQAAESLVARPASVIVCESKDKGQ